MRILERFTNIVGNFSFGSFLTKTVQSKEIMFK